jgi:hypothetical protein
MALPFGKLKDALVAAGAPAGKAAAAAEEVAGEKLLHRMERRMVRVDVLVGSTPGGVGLVGAGVLASVLKAIWAEKLQGHMRRGA